jgi:hypothetical protein
VLTVITAVLFAEIDDVQIAAPAPEESCVIVIVVFPELAKVAVVKLADPAEVTVKVFVSPVPVFAPLRL